MVAGCGCTTAIRNFHQVKRELTLAVDPSLYPQIEGSTDSETFFPALTLGLEDDPPAAVQRAVGRIEDVGRRHGVEHPIQMTVATTDGQRVWAFRYSSEGQSRSLFFSTDISTLRHQYPGNPVLHQLSDETRLVVGAARRPRRCLERGPRVELWRHPAGAGRAAPVRRAPGMSSYPEAPEVDTGRPPGGRAVHHAPHLPPPRRRHHRVVVAGASQACVAALARLARTRARLRAPSGRVVDRDPLRRRVELFLIAPFPGFVELVGRASTGWCSSSARSSSPRRPRSSASRPSMPTVHRAGGHRRFRLLAFEPRRIDGGAACSSSWARCTSTRTPSGRCRRGSRSRRMTGWSGDLTRSDRCASSSLATWRTSRSAVVSRRPRRGLEWQIAAVNLAGCVASGSRPSPPLSSPRPEASSTCTAANAFTAFGALCFLVGAVLLLPESAADHGDAISRTR